MFVQVGDIHLEKRVTKLFEDDREGRKAQVAYSIKALRKVFDWCRNEGVSEVVIAGDLFDNPYPKQSTITALSEFLAEYKDIKVIVIPGNHDHVSNDEHSLETLSWIGRLEVLSLQVIMTPTIMKIGGMKCWVCPHPFVEASPSKVDWSVGHFAWSGAMMDNGYKSKSTKRPKGEWLLGDFHTYQEGDRYRYSGSLTQLSRTELGDKGFLAVEKRKATFFPIKKDYHIETLKLSNTNDVDRLEKTRDGAPVYWWIYQDDPDVALPKNWQIKYPHILDYTPLPQQKSDNDNNVNVLSFSDDPTEGLNEWTASRLHKDIKNGKRLSREVSRIEKLGKQIQKMRA